MKALTIKQPWASLIMERMRSLELARTDLACYWRAT